MKYKYLSIYNDSAEIVDYCRKYNLFTEEELNDDNLDLLSLFEGDPDFLVPKNTKDYNIYFFCNNNEGMVITTAEFSAEMEPIQSFFEHSSEWTVKEQETDKDIDRIYYRGGSGYYYTLYERN